MLTALLLSSTTSCTRLVEVPVAVPAPKCPLPDYPAPPDIQARTDGERVVFAWQDAVDLAKWIGAVTRWHELAQVCLDSRDAPP